MDFIYLFLIWISIPLAIGPFCIGENLKVFDTFRDTFYYFQGYGDIMLSIFVGDICDTSFRDMGHFSNYLKEYGILGPPIPGHH